MMQITCPLCGPRDQCEFKCGGEAHIQRPVNPEAVSDSEWADYLFMRQSPTGLHHERWLHLYGCGLWFHISRDMLTHEIKQIYGMHKTPLEISE